MLSFTFSYCKFIKFAILLALSLFPDYERGLSWSSKSKYFLGLSAMEKEGRDSGVLKSRGR